MNSRKRKRQESKLKKATAFLKLVKAEKIEEEEAAAIEKEETADHTISKSNSSKMASLETATTQLPPAEHHNDDTEMNGKTPKEITEMQMIIRKRKKDAMQKPKVFLTLEDMVPYAPVDTPLPPEAIPPVYVMDLQQLLLYGVQGNLSRFKPRWCKLLRPGKVSSVIFIHIDGVGFSDYKNNQDCFPYIKSTFQSQCEVINPQQYFRTFHEELYHVPLSVNQIKKANVKVPDKIKAMVAAKLAPPPPKGEEIKEGKDNSLKDNTSNAKKNSAIKQISRTCLLLSTKQMIRETYPMPIFNNNASYEGFVFSKAEYKKVSDDSPLFAVDCEMCLTTAKKNELTRVSIIAENGDVIYDKLVKPANRITNYLTRYSGITKEMLDPVTTTIHDVHRDFREILPADAILVGQSLNCDLVALKLFHPYVIDTSIIFNMSGIKGIKAGLRKLTQEFLGRAIQTGHDGHCSNEDALAALDLVKLKLTKGLEFGDATLVGIYFPDIKTYFLGDGSAKKTENIEKESPLSQPSTDSSTKIDQSSIKACEKKTSEDSKNGHDGSSDSDSDSDCSDNENKNKKEQLESKDEDSPPEKKAKKELETSFNLSSSTDFVAEQTRFIFSQENSVHINTSFFKIVSEAGRPACMVGRPGLTASYSREPMDVLTVHDDSDARRTAKAALPSRQFAWLGFSEMAEAGDPATLTDQRRQKIMRKLDNRVKSVLKQAKSDALAVVLMTGNTDRENMQNMVAHIAIT